MISWQNILGKQFPFHDFPLDFPSNIYPQVGSIPVTKQDHTFSNEDPNSAFREFGALGYPYVTIRGSIFGDPKSES